ncbi:hypothetical protein ACVIGB_001767 [Bradyrhizobium sp. USDA 4341]
MIVVDVHASDHFVTEWLVEEAERRQGQVAAPRERTA